MLKSLKFTPYPLHSGKNFILQSRNQVHKFRDQVAKFKISTLSKSAENESFSSLNDEAFF